MKNVSSAVKYRAESIYRRHLYQEGGPRPEEKYRWLRIKKGVYRF